MKPFFLIVSMWYSNHGISRINGPGTKYWIIALCQLRLISRFRCLISVGTELYRILCICFCFFPHPFFFFSVLVRFTPTFFPIHWINCFLCVCVCVHHPKGAQPAKKKKKGKMEDQSVFASAEEVDDLWAEWNNVTLHNIFKVFIKTIVF